MSRQTLRLVAFGKRPLRIAFLLTIFSLLLIGVASAAPIFVVDDNGADDEPGQKDLNALTVDYGLPGAPTINVKWNWDDTATSGANTRDAGALFDTDGDGSANYSLYETVAADGTWQTQLYACAADSNADRCGGPSLVAAFASTASVSTETNSDPFGVPSSPAYDPLHVIGNTCDAKNGCYTDDTVASVTVVLNDLGNPADVNLINVCSYPSGQPNSDPSDCVFEPNNGFLTIVKVANPDDDTAFVFTTSLPSEEGNSSWTINGSGSVQFISFEPGAGYDLSEAIPDSWKLDSASCTIQTSPSTTPTGTQPVGTPIYGPADAGVTDFEIRSGLETICTFTDSIAEGTLTLAKTVVNDNGGTAVADDFQAYIDGAAVEWGTTYTYQAGATVTASEGLANGYTASAWGGDCAANGSVTIEAGANRTCTITNDDDAPSLTLVKIVVNDNGGNAVATDFTLSASGPTPISGAGGASSDASFDAGTYNLSETTLPGYTASDWVCAGGTQDDADTVTVGLGQDVTCTITNDDVAAQLRVMKTVVNDDGGNAVVGDFPLFIDGAPATSGEFIPVTANAVHSVSETSQPGYTASVWGGDCNPDGTVILNEGDVKTCTITNDDVAPTLKLVKVVVNDNGGNAVADGWTLSAAAASPFDGRNFSNLGGSGVFNTVFANQGYNLSESTVPGYLAGDWSCDGGTLVGSTVTLAEGETGVTCTITNDDVASTLTLIKNVINDNGGNAAPDDFSLTIGGNAALSGVAYTLGANTPYAINETLLAGYTFVDITGDPECPAVLGGTVTLDEGENVTCTITNDDVAPTLTLIKNVVNDHGGTAQPDDFSLTIGGDPATSGTAYPLDANTPYAINETLVPGYSFVSIVGDPECPALLGGTVTLDEGENVTCTITNNDQAATLIVIKHVVNDNGGAADAADFTLDSGGVDDTPDNFAGEEAPGTTVTLDAGAYNVTETGPAGYSASFSADCAGTIANGQTKTCTVTNDDIQPQLIVIKHVINDNGGAAAAASFTMQVTGNNVNPVSFPGSELGVNVALDAGSYSVSETGPAGYAASFSADCAGAIAVGETKTCTVTNNDISPTLTVVKVLLPANDLGLFNLQIDGATKAANVGNNGTTGPVAVSAGAHTVGETAGTGTSLSGYVTTIGGDCNPDGTVSLALAENKTCTITNVRRGSIVIVKNALGGDGTFNFTSGTLGNFSLTTAGGAASVTFSGLDPANTYDVAETVPPGWELNSANCDSGETIGSIDLDPGETVTCTFENEKFGSIVIVKNTVGGNGQFDFTSSTLGNLSLTTVNGTASATFSGLDVDLTYDIAETVPAGWDLTSATCDKGETIGSIDLEPGETVNCTFTNTKRAIIVIEKEAVPDDPQDFSFTAIESTDTPIPDFQLDDDADGTLPKTISFSDLKPGNYAVTETLVPGWDLTGMGCASTVNMNSNVGVDLNTATATIALGPGDTVSCYFRNTKRGHIIVDKVTDPSGDPQSFAFDAQGGFSPVYADFNLTDASTPNDQELRYGTYSVAETVPAGWDLTSATCTSSLGDNETSAAIELDPGETVNCTFTNVKRASLTIVKRIVNDNGGTKTVGDFGITTDAGALTFDAGAPDGAGTLRYTSNTLTNLLPGTKALHEGVVAGYAEGTWSCVGNAGAVVGDPQAGSVVLGPGESVTCTIMNDDIAPKLHLRKVVVNDNGGQATAANFTLTANGTGTNDLSGTSPVDSGPGLNADTWALSETTVTGYQASAWSCVGGTQNGSNITLGIGQEATCTITNDDIQPQLIVIKHVINNDGRDASASDFTMVVTGSSPSPASFPGAESPGTTVAINAGSYSVSETGPQDYAATYSADCSGTIAVGQIKTCTVTNDDVKQTGALLPTQTTCEMYKAGLTDPTKWPEMYAAFNYRVRNNAINSISPGVIFYFNRISVNAAGNIQVVETNNTVWKSMLYQAAGQAILYNYSNCGKSGIIGSGSLSGTNDSVYTVTFTNVPAGDYIIGIKYSPKNVIGQPVSRPYPMSTFSWRTNFGGTYVPGSTAEIPLQYKP